MGKINKIQELLQKQAEASRQLMILGTVLFTVGVMAIATIQISNAADADVNVAQNVSAGALAITAPPQLNFTDGGVGDTTNANIVAGVGNAITIADTRGNLDGWDVTGFFNTNWIAASATIQMAISTDVIMNWAPSAMAVENNTGHNDGVNKGADADFGGTDSGNSLTLATSNNGHEDNGAGSYNIFNIVFNYTIPIAAAATDYTTDFRLTIL